MAEGSRVVLTVRCAKCRQVRGWVVARDGERLWVMNHRGSLTPSARKQRSRLSAMAPPWMSVKFPEQLDWAARGGPAPVPFRVFTPIVGGVPQDDAPYMLGKCQCVSRSTSITIVQLRELLKRGLNVVSLAPVNPGKE